MKIKDGFLVRKIANQYMAVPVGTRTKDLHGMIALNETGAFLWNLLKDDQTEENLVGKLMEEYEVDVKRASASVKRLIVELQQNEVLEDE